MADKSGGLGMLQTMYEEGGEEVKQDILAKLLAKLLYDHDAEYFSASDEDAVFNPNRAFDAFSGGAAREGVFRRRFGLERPCPGPGAEPGKRPARVRTAFSRAVRF